MIDYTGTKCPVCGQPFLKGDDIVVCPECGTPYHRACYQKAGSCIFSEKHGTGEVWQAPHVEAPNPDQEAADNICPHCGNHNPHSSLFCSQCGYPLSGGPEQHANSSYQQGRYRPDDAPGPQQGQDPYGGSPFGWGGSYPPPYGQGQPPQGGQQIPTMFDPMGGVNPADTLDGVPAGDLARLVQNNTPYYMPVFLNYKRFRRGRFNFCAFLFSGGWMLYRKMYKLGGILTGVLLLLYLANTIMTVNYSIPITREIFSQIGIDILRVTPDYYQMLQAAQILSSYSAGDIFLVAVPMIASLIQFGIQIFCGIQGNKLYCTHCIRKAKKIQAQTSGQEDYHNHLQSEGGVNMAVTICLLICYMLLNWLPRFL